jgi:alpha-beta hydrolase superfamily lysophospholipase
LSLGHDRASTVPRIESYQSIDGQNLAVRVWESPREPLAQVVFLHGIVSHGGWYTASAAHLATAGYNVHFLERRGSGLNEAARGDVDQWRVWLDDVEIYLNRVRDHRPVVLCGISWGGKLAAAVARSRPNLLDGLVMICPGIFARQQPGRLAQWSIRLARFRLLSRLQVRIPLRQPALFTGSREWQHFLRNDTLALRRITLRFAAADLALTAYARDAAALILAPTLLMLAGRDTIVDNVRTREFFDQIAATEKQLIEYPDAAHTLEFEADPSTYFSDLAEFIGRVAGAR